MFTGAVSVEQRLLKLMVMNLSCYAINASRRLYSCVAVTFCNCAPLCTVCTCNFATMHSFRQPQTGSGYSQQSRNCNVFVTSPAGSGGGPPVAALVPVHEVHLLVRQGGGGAEEALKP